VVNDVAWRSLALSADWSVSNADRIFVLQTGNDLVELIEAPYESEEVLQQLLAKHPDLLAGYQISSTAPRRWLLVSREMGVPDADVGSDRWALDHLFLDQDGIPTLVEVKRSSDTRLRREVVGQMLDYAANGVAYWTIEKLRAAFDANCKKVEISPEQAVAEVAGDAIDPEDYWHLVKTNLQVHNLRLVFVADSIPAELRRIIEFLNAQMDPVEVLGIEVKHYRNATIRTIVPRLVGRTAEAEARKSGSSVVKRQWDETSFFAELSQYRGEAEVEVARRILDWAKQNDFKVYWGTGAVEGSFSPRIVHKGVKYQLFAVWTWGRMNVYFDALARRPMLPESVRLEALRQLNRIGTIGLPEEAASQYARIDLEQLTGPGQTEAFLKVFDELATAIRNV
jgi:hypothetical protein